MAWEQKLIHDFSFITVITKPANQSMQYVSWYRVDY